MLCFFSGLTKGLFPLRRVLRRVLGRRVPRPPIEGLLCVCPMAFWLQVCRSLIIISCHVVSEGWKQPLDLNSFCRHTEAAVTATAAIHSSLWHCIPPYKYYRVAKPRAGWPLGIHTACLQPHRGASKPCLQTIKIQAVCVREGINNITRHNQDKPLDLLMFVLSMHDASFICLPSGWRWSEQARSMGAAARRARMQAASLRWTSSAWAARTASSSSTAVSNNNVM